jgi:UDP:flavonoid glycosyltransferase YjiC (YdhE family)
MPKNILITIPALALSHEIRCFEVGKHLAQKGVDVSLLVNGSTKFIESLKNSEPSEQISIKCASFTCTGGNAKIHKSSLDFYAKEDIFTEFTKIEELLHKYQPDLVISDVFPIMSLACEKLGILHVSFASASWTNYYGLSRSSLKWDWVGQLLGNPLRQIIRQRMRFSLDKKLYTWGTPLNTLARSLGLRTRRNILSYFEGNGLTLITDTPKFGPLNNPPGNFKYCGPILWYPPFSSQDLIKTLDPEKNTIYISFGSTGKFSIIEDIVWRLLKEDYQVILTLSGIQLSKKISQHPNFVSANLINSWEVIPMCNVVIFHGGIGTAYQVLACGKPSITIPFHIEQFWNACRLEELGISYLLNSQLISKKRLLSAITRLLAEEQHIQSRLYGMCDRNTLMDSPRKAAYLIYDLIN